MRWVEKLDIKGSSFFRCNSQLQGDFLEWWLNLMEYTIGSYTFMTVKDLNHLRCDLNFAFVLNLYLI